MNSKRLIALCQKIGARTPEWTQGAGGNLSVKAAEGDELLLWIKASGSRLDGVSTSGGLAVAGLQPLLRELTQLDMASADAESSYSEILARHSRRAPNLGRLSMETGFHAFLPRRWVLHFHSAAAVLMAEASRTEASRWRLWLQSQSKLIVRVVPAEMPGLELSKALAKLEAADAYLLTSHGVVLHSDDERVLDDWSVFEQAFCRDWNYPQLLTLLRSENPLAAAKVQWGGGSAPLRLYFPDTAVFLDQLDELLEHTPNGERRLPADAWTKQANLGEIWLATLLLYSSNAELAELPLRITSKVAKLPTEKLRRGEKS